MGFVTRLQHTSVPMPADGAERARDFYGGALAMTEKTPPSSLSNIVWFEAGPNGDEVHCFVDFEFEAIGNQQHLCLQVNDLEALRAQLTERGVPIEETIPITNRPRFFVRDPFENLIELVQITGDYD
ncbi:MAG: VOC family protein [Thermomicrobiales bacterium]|nr:VOC family protein [Thermomicrobiales bacterium]